MALVLQGPSTRSVQKALVLKAGPPKRFKKHWFYDLGHGRATGPPKPIHRATDRATDSGAGIPILGRRNYVEPSQTSCLGNNWFYYRTSPGHGRATDRATDSGAGQPILVRIYYVEPLQTNCLRKNRPIGTPGE